jgi:hypothetical protein
MNQQQQVNQQQTTNNQKGKQMEQNRLLKKC